MVWSERCISLVWLLSSDISSPFYHVWSLYTQKTCRVYRIKKLRLFINWLNMKWFDCCQVIFQVSMMKWWNGVGLNRCKCARFILFPFLFYKLPPPLFLFHTLPSLLLLPFLLLSLPIRLPIKFSIRFGFFCFHSTILFFYEFDLSVLWALPSIRFPLLFPIVLFFSFFSLLLLLLVFSTKPVQQLVEGCVRWCAFSADGQKIVRYIQLCKTCE